MLSIILGIYYTVSLARCGLVYRKIWDGYPFPFVSVDAIDMTVSMHHVIQYASDIRDHFIHTRNTLKTGGVLHLGEGGIDMKYSERKIRKIDDDVLASGVRGVMASDSRNADISARKWQVGEEAEAMIHVTSNGMVSIHHPDIETVSSHLAKSGYKQMYVTDNAVMLPLIDHSMEEDFQDMIASVLLTIMPYPSCV